MFILYFLHIQFTITVSVRIRSSINLSALPVVIMAIKAIMAIMAIDREKHTLIYCAHKTIFTSTFTLG